MNKISTQVKGIKFQLGDQTKRINESVENFEILIEKTRAIFNIISSKLIKLYHEEEPGKKTEISQENYQAITDKSSPNCLKIIVVLEETYDLSSKSNRSSIEKDFDVSDALDDNISYKMLKSQTENSNPAESNTLFLNSKSKEYDLSIEFMESIIEKVTDKLKQEEEFSHEYFLNVKNPPANLLETLQIHPNKNADQSEELEPIEEEIRDDQNNIRLVGSEIEFVDIDNELKPRANSIFEDVCSICSRGVFYVKYVCCICNNMTICEKCEQLHNHPLFKFKEKELSTKNEILNLMLLNQERNCPVESKGLISKVKKISESFFEKKFQIILSVLSNDFTVRQNKNFKIPITLSNNSKASFPSTKVLLISKNNKDLKILSKKIDLKLNPKEHYEVMLECESNNQIKVHEFEIFLYCDNNSIKIESEPLKLRIAINDNVEEEEVNDYFAMYPKILTIKHKEKEMIMNIIKEGISMKHPYIIYHIMSDAEWDVENALDELTLDDRSQMKAIQI